MIYANHVKFQGMISLCLSLKDLIIYDLQRTAS